MIEHASQWTWQTWFASSVVVIGFIVFAAAKWMANKHDALIQELAIERKAKDALFERFIQSSENTNKLLATALEHNTAALAENSRVLERVKERI